MMLPRGTLAQKTSVHVAWWEGLWNRSHIDLPNRATDPTQRLIEAHAVWQRFLDVADGRGAKAAIKFNGQMWNVDEGSGPDFRTWGADYWWQNTRQPYYNALISGDLDGEPLPVC